LSKLQLDNVGLFFETQSILEIIDRDIFGDIQILLKHCKAKNSLYISSLMSQMSDSLR